MQAVLSPVSSVPTDCDLSIVPAMTTEELRAALVTTLRATARHMLYLAAIWAELEKRGEDLTALRRGLMVYLPLVAAGAVLPDVLIQFAGHPSHLKAVSSLPPDRQQRIVDGESVQLVVRQGDQFTHRMLPVHALSAAQVRQVFGTRCVRSEAEQIAVLTDHESPRPVRGRGPSHDGIRADRRKGVLLHGWKELEPAAVLAALADLNAGDDTTLSSADPAVSARLTPAEHETLKKRAAAGKTTIAALIRNALRATGQI